MPILLYTLLQIIITSCLSQQHDSEYNYLRGLSSSSSLSLSSQSIINDTSNKNNDSDSDNDNIHHQEVKQRIILIAGPHKTGSSSIQYNMYHWMMKNDTTTDLENNNDQDEVIQSYFKDWIWPEPKEIYNKYTGHTHMHHKIFYPFGEALLPYCRIGHRKELSQYYTCEELLDIYRKEFQKYWDLGYNLAIGTEAFDFVGFTNNNGIQIDHLLDQMPWNYENSSLLSSSSSLSSSMDTTKRQHNNIKESITVVVKYRSPRVKHLISWWHQCCMKQMNFYDFLLEETTNWKYRERGSRIIDSLYLVQQYLDHGLKVALIDTSGVIEKGYDLSNVIACDVLNIPCTQDKVIQGETQLPTVKNQKSDGDLGGITENHLNQMEQVIRMRDCSFQHLLGHQNLTILYPLDIHETLLQTCKGIVGISREEMNVRILQIIKNKSNMIETNH